MYYVYLAEFFIFSFNRNLRPKYRILRASVLHKYTLIAYLYISSMKNTRKNRLLPTL